MWSGVVWFGLVCCGGVRCCVLSSLVVWCGGGVVVWVARLPLVLQNKGAVGIIVGPREIFGFLVLTEENQFYRFGFRGAASGSLTTIGNTMGNHWILIVDARYL